MIGGYLAHPLALKEQEQILEKFYLLPQNNKIQAEYIWIGGDGELRSKCKTLNFRPKSAKELEIWNYDGSSTNQASGHNSEVYIRPVKIVRDPFRKGKNILVMTETLDPETMKPLATNKRFDAKSIFKRKDVKDEKPWFGIEQEYTLFCSDGITPLGWPKNGYPAPQGPYYCGVGTGKAVGREVVEAHYEACLYAGLDISGVNAEVMCGQWEYQIGPCEGIDSGDQLWLSRYILERVAEKFDVKVTFAPKPIKGDWNGTGCHTNYSTKTMRKKGGYNAILNAIERLSKRHFEHMAIYGDKNKERLTGLHETAPWDKFSFGVANRGASVRIPRTTSLNKRGYFEDRRPASNMDPYQVTSMLAYTTIVWQDQSANKVPNV